MRYVSNNHRKHLVLLAVSLIALQSGCTLLSTSQLPVIGGKKPEFEVPRQVVPVWSDTVLHQPNATATRGFGGRLMFYGQDKHKPIRVEGSLIVYAWDDSKGSMERAPDRKYVFPAETLQEHYSKSRLGHSYSFWVPWDAAGGPMQRLTLISRFLSKDGTELTGTPAHVVLQGPSDSSPFPDEVREIKSINTQPDQDSGNELSLSERFEKKRKGRIQQASYSPDELAGEHGQEAPTNGRSYPAPAHPGLKTSEIGLTRGFYERNMQGTSATHSGAVFNAMDVNEILAPDPMKKSVQGNSNNAGQHAANETSVDSNDAEAEELLDQPSDELPPFQSRVRTSRVIGSSVGPVPRKQIRSKLPNGLPKTPRP